MVIYHIDVNEGITVINSLKNSSPGYDGIPTTLAKGVINSYIILRTLLINHSFSVGSFPDELKLEKSYTYLHNYRPISVLNTFSILYENLMYNQLIATMLSSH